MVYGPETAQPGAPTPSPSLSKLFSMGEGFASYSTATGSAPSQQDGGGAAGAAGAAAGGEAQEALVDLLLSADGNYVQELLLDEAAKLADAAVRLIACA